ncbi:MAG: hypothetical protein HDS65_10880 [Bacteroidales bacterium]|nr:hypothetical protein [Bacteroidales bacterium]
MADIKELIRRNVEIEGLLKVLLERGSLDARSLLAEKFTEYQAMFNELLAEPTPEAAREVAHEGAALEAEAQQTEVKDQEAVSVEEEDETDAATAAIERGEEEEKEEREEREVREPEKEAQEEPKREEPEVKEEPVAPAAPAKPRKANTALLKAFTLNDKFRFIRDIFNGSEGEFTDTLNVLADMENAAEATDYLLNDMMLDGENPDVADFLAIVCRAMPQ